MTGSGTELREGGTNHPLHWGLRSRSLSQSAAISEGWEGTRSEDNTSTHMSRL